MVRVCRLSTIVMNYVQCIPHMCTLFQGTEALLACLQSADPAVCLAALRAVKNAVIGSTTKKILYARQGVVPMYAVSQSSVILWHVLRVMYPQ